MMNEYRRPHHIGKVILGLTVVAFGVIFLLGNLRVIESRHYLQYWPVLLIAFGLAKLVAPRGHGGRMFGFIVGTIGVLLLLQHLGKITWSIWSLWPLLLVLIGLSIIWGGFGRHPRRMRFERRYMGTGPFGGDAGAGPARQVDPDSVLQISSVFGGNERLVTSQDFRGGTISTIMGGCDIDFRQASMTVEEATIDVSIVFGGVQLRIPEDWKVVTRLSTFMGGVDDRSRKPVGDGKKTLVITGSLVFGGFEIRN